MKFNITTIQELLMEYFFIDSSDCEPYAVFWCIPNKQFDMDKANIYKQLVAHSNFKGEQVKTWHILFCDDEAQEDIKDYLTEEKLLTPGYQFSIILPREFNQFQINSSYISLFVRKIMQLALPYTITSELKSELKKHRKIDDCLLIISPKFVYVEDTIVSVSPVPDNAVIYTFEPNYDLDEMKMIKRNYKNI
jgi:hypothetical protein